MTTETPSPGTDTGMSEADQLRKIISAAQSRNFFLRGILEGLDHIIDVENARSAQVAMVDVCLDMAKEIDSMLDSTNLPERAA